VVGLHYKFTADSVGKTMLTSGQSNLTTGRIATAYGWFSDIRHVAPVCTRT